MYFLFEILMKKKGGKIAQSVLMNRDMATRVNTVIAIASPIDTPVLNIDFYSEGFYRKSNKFWLAHRPPSHQVITNLTNTCCNASNFASSIFPVVEANKATDSPNLMSYDKQYFLKDVLLITIGGGSRDLLVHAGLTTSKFSDVHTMSTCMPNVWLTTDHLSSVWCLQQVLVVNRFLYSIIESSNHRQRNQGNSFIPDKEIRLGKAKRYLTVKHKEFIFKSVVFCLMFSIYERPILSLFVARYD